MDCIFKVGETVRYTNEFGISFDDFVITKIEKASESDHWYVEKCFTPDEFVIYGGLAHWFPHHIDSFTKLNSLH